MPAQLQAQPPGPPSPSSAPAKLGCSRCTNVPRGTGRGGGAKPVSSWMPTSLPRALARSRGGSAVLGDQAGPGSLGLRRLPRLESPFPCPAPPHPGTHRGALPGVGGGGRAGLGEAGVHSGVVGVPGQGGAGAHGMAGERRLGQGPRGGLQGRACSGGFAPGAGTRRGPPHPRTSHPHIQQCPKTPTPGLAVPPWGATGPPSPWGAGGSPGRWRGRAWAGAGGGSWPGCSRWTRTRGW